MNCLAFIPARGGSKRLPGKNIMQFCGKPLIYYTIKQALACKRINKVVVSTDHEEIARVAKEFGAEVIMRSEELSTDISTTASAVKHGLLSLQADNYYTDAVITLQVTSPLRPVSIIDEAIRLYKKNTDCHSVIGVTTNRHKLGVINKKGYYQSTNYQTGTRSQDLSKQYFENGMVYVTNPNLVLNEEDLFGTKIIPLVIDEFYAEIDIDLKEDFDLAELLYKHYNNLFIS